MHSWSPVKRLENWFLRDGRDKDSEAAELEAGSRFIESL